MILSALSIPAKAPLVTSPIAIFLIVMAIILLVPMLLSRLKIPHVIGLILAGVVVGPHGFNVLARDMSFEVFGQVGLLFLMFLAGVEIDMYHLKKNLRRGVIFGLYTFFIPLLLGVVIGLTLLRFDMITSMMLASMFAAHTLLAYPIVSRFGLTKSPAVVIAIAGTIFTVLGSLIVLAGAVGVVRSGQFDMMLLLRLVGGLVLFCGIVAWLYPKVTRWVFRRHNDGIVQFVYVLAMVFLASEIAVAIGIEAVFGAFYSGIVLNRYIPQRSPLMGRLEFVGNALFIPYFLIGVGMLINVQVLISGWDTIYVAAIMSVTAMAGKWLAALVTQKTFRMRAVDRSMLYQLSNAHTAVALAVVMIGFQLGIFGQEILDGTVLMILVTCTVSSVGTSRAASKLKVLSLQTEEVADDSRQRPKGTNTLIPVVNVHNASELVNLALMLNDPQKASNRMYALHVRNDNSPESRALGQMSLEKAQNVAASVEAKMKTIERYDLNFVTGVLNAIEERDINQVVVGLHRRTGSSIDSFFGDKLTQLLKATYRMVVISRMYIPINTIHRIVVWVPDKAQYETGFSRWVRSLGNIARQLGCRIIFCCSKETRPSIQAVLKAGRFEIRSEFRHTEQWDDFILLSNKVREEDLLVVVNSRRASVSFTTDMDELPEFLRRYFSANNLLVIYPEQFGDQSAVPMMAEVLSADVEAAPSKLWLAVMRQYRRAVALQRRLFGPHRPTDRRIDL